VEPELCAGRQAFAWAGELVRRCFRLGGVPHLPRVNRIGQAFLLGKMKKMQKRSMSRFALRATLQPSAERWRLSARLFTARVNACPSVRDAEVAGGVSRASEDRVAVCKLY